MRVFGTVNTKHPLSVRQHIAAGRLLQQLYQVACGERPTVMVPMQRNPRREGCHSHPSIFGTERLLEVRRDEIHAELMARLRNEPGIGVETVSLAVVNDRLGSTHYRRYEERTEAGWQLLTAVNEPRVRLEPCRNFADALGYATRYASRETDALELLPGDNWRL